ncbi:protein of unknown function [Vibrio tapetis subsp. tapetis]|uniref:Uncharacterized protein n=1 Tax=Vibrio tapetis subsp. tapetis TaxID=1671868 RepID=A0A2N8ZEP7_9VIBR|nr:protein of unknown function [Vibrio tapetis subsp. tapetis]
MFSVTNLMYGFNDYFARGDVWHILRKCEACHLFKGGMSYLSV